MINRSKDFKMADTSFALHPHTVTLPCGLRILQINPPCTQAGNVVCCGIAVDAGTRDELDDEGGMAHFCEHASFKGTRRRNAVHIASAIDSVGGELNAFTTKESTIYYALILAPYLAQAIDVLCDIVFNSTFPQLEIEKEAKVVADEIEAYNDSPAELIFDEFEQALFGKHPLGRSILGDAERLAAYSTIDLKRFSSRLYKPRRMALFVVGGANFDDIVYDVRLSLRRAGLDADQFAAPEPFKRVAPEQDSPKVLKIERDVHQAHVIVGCQAYSYKHPLHWALALLNNMLGGPALNSRLNIILRECNPLVYNIESFLYTYTDVAAWGVYFGCDKKDIDICLRLVRKELKAFAARPVAPLALRKAKTQMKGQIGIAAGNIESVALCVAKHFLHRRLLISPDLIYEQIDQVTAEQILQAAQELFNFKELTQVIYV